MSVRSTTVRFWSVWLGNLFEHYDTALYGFLSPFLAPLFFPQKDPITALVLTYALIPLAMLARPFGALFFGKIGDLYGRERSLLFSLLGMAVLTVGIACLPTHAEIGISAPILLCVARVCQNFLSAGEVMGGAIFLLEGFPAKKHDLLSSFYGASTIGGILLASVLVFVLGHFQVIDTGWRFLYLIGGATALFGCYFRTQLPRATSPSQGFFGVKTLQTLWQMRGPLGIITLTSGFSYATYSLSIVLMNGFIPIVSSLTKESMLSLNLLFLVLDFAALPCFGRLAARIGREKLMLYTVLASALLALPLALVLEGGTLWGLFAVRTSLVLLGVAFFAPYHAFAQQLVPESHRYLVISFGYALGSQLFGAPTSFISLLLFRKTACVSSILWYWAALALAIAIVVPLFLRSKKQGNDMDDVTIRTI